MSKIHDIVFQIKSNLASSVAQNFTKVSALTNKTTVALGKLYEKNPFSKLNPNELAQRTENLKIKNESLVSSLSRTQSRTDKLRNQYNLAQKTCKNLAQEIKESGQATQKQSEEFRKAIAKSDALKKKWREQLEQSKALRKEIKSQVDELKQLEKVSLISRAKSSIANVKSKFQGNSSTHVQNIANSAYAAQVAARSLNFMSEPLHQAMKFESVMADIRKLVHFDTPQEFAEMGEQLKQLSLRVPMAVDGLGHIAAAAAQAGIAKNEIMTFTENAAQMGVAYNISAEQAGDMMAKWRSAFSMNQTQVMQLADQINILSDNSAATGSEIGEVVTRIGSLGKIAGVTQAQISALAATSIGGGFKSDVAATGIKKMLTVLSSAEGVSRKQAYAFESMGVNVVTLAKDIRERGAPAMLDILKKIKGMDEYKQVGFLKEIFGEEAIGPIAAIAQNIDQVEKNLLLTGDASKYSGSMLREFAARSATTENNVQLFKNSLAAVGITIGTTFLPAINESIGKINELLQNSIMPYIVAHKEAIETIGMFAVGLVALVAGMAGVKAATSALSLVLDVGKTAFKLVGGVAWDFLKTLRLLIPAKYRAAAATKVMNFYQRIANALAKANPYVKLAMYLIAVGSAVYWVCTHWEEFKVMLGKVWEKVKGFIGMILKLKNALTSLFDGNDGKHTIEIDAELKNKNKFSGQLEQQITGKTPVNQTMTINSSTMINAPNGDAKAIGKEVGTQNQQTMSRANDMFSGSSRFSNQPA